MIAPHQQVRGRRSTPASAVNSSGNTSLGVRYTASGSNAQFASREDEAHKPQLIVSYALPDPNGKTLIPTADTYVNSNQTGTNYATTTPLAASPNTKRSLLRFATSGAVPSGKTLASATLKIWVTSMDTVGTGFEVHPASDTWTESGATWSNQPTWNSTVLASSGTPTAGAWLSITLPTSAISTSGNTSLGLKYTVSGSNAYFSSREYVPQAPQLILTWQ